MSHNDPDAISDTIVEDGFDAPNPDLDAPSASAVLPTLGDQVSDFIHRQPLLTLSLAFGLGLLATSFLTRRTS